VQHGLSPPHKRFCDEYLVELNATQAYVAAYPSAKRTSAAQAGSRLLRNVKVAAYLSWRQKIFTEKADRRKQAIIAELEGIGLTKITDLCSWDNGQVKLVASGNLTPEIAASVKKVRIKPGAAGRGKEITLEMHDKTPALRTLAEHHGLLEHQPDEDELKKRGIKIYVAPTFAPGRLRVPAAKSDA